MSQKISIKVSPNAGRNEVIGCANGIWKIKIAAPPDKGKANKELIDYLSELLGIQKGNLYLIKGQTSHNKMVSIEGLTSEIVDIRLTAGKRK